MKPEQLEKWKETRQKGMLRFVLVNGVLAYGLIMFIVMTFVVHRDKLSVNFICISAIVWSIGGALFGVLMWIIGERKFRKVDCANR
ncbi:MULTISPECIES: hypothetical protein [unclassified Lysobacter]